MHRRAGRLYAGENLFHNRKVWNLTGVYGGNPFEKVLRCRKHGRKPVPESGVFAVFDVVFWKFAAEFFEIFCRFLIENASVFGSVREKYPDVFHRFGFEKRSQSERVFELRFPYRQIDAPVLRRKSAANRGKKIFDRFFFYAAFSKRTVVGNRVEESDSPNFRTKFRKERNDSSAIRHSKKNDVGIIENDVVSGIRRSPSSSLRIFSRVQKRFDRVHRGKLPFRTAESVVFGNEHVIPRVR